MGCTPSKSFRSSADTEAKPNRSRAYTSPEESRGSAMPDGQAARLHQKHKEREQRQCEDCSATANSSTTFNQLADRGVISKDALKRGSYVPK